MSSIVSRMSRSLRDRYAFIKMRFSGGAEHIKLGRLGEDLAINALIESGYEVVDRNRIVLKREVDVIARDGATLVFIEVKTRKSDKFGSPAEAINKKRQKRLKQAAELYCMEQKLTNKVSVRFDVVTVDYTKSRTPDVEIIKNAF